MKLDWKLIVLPLLFLIFMAVPVKAPVACGCDSCSVNCQCPDECPADMEGCYPVSSHCCTNGPYDCATYYLGETVHYCGYYAGTSASCDAANQFCTPDSYYTATSCSASNPKSCSTADRTHSCGSTTTCGKCTGLADTCGTAACGDTYGCNSPTNGVCDGLGTGATHCLAPFDTNAACNCSQQCTSGVCTGNKCQPYIGAGTNKCGYYNGTSATCNSNTANNYCAVGTYFIQACSSSPTNTSCAAVSASGACAICGNCTGSADTCAAAACGTTNNYGCANMCAGNTTGSSACITAGSLAVNSACLCNAVCASGLCTGGVCKSYRASGTNLCGYYNGSSASCGTATYYCAVGTYYPSQACTLDTSAPSCTAVSSSASCAICGNCTGGSDTCGTAACGTTNNYGCSGTNICDGLGTGASHCVAAGGAGATCYCNAMCTSQFTCVSNLCKDTTLPTYSSNSTNSTLAGTYIKHNLAWADNVGLSGYNFSFDNGTGTFVNDSWVAMTGTANWSNVSKWVNITVGTIIRWCVYANDTSNNWNVTSCSPSFNYTTGPIISTDQMNYSSCGAVLYKVRLFNSSGSLLNSTLTTRILNPSGTIKSQVTSVPNNGTGIYLGSYQLEFNASLGTWTIKVTELSGITGAVSVTVSNG